MVVAADGPGAELIRREFGTPGAGRGVTNAARGVSGAGQGAAGTGREVAGAGNETAGAAGEVAGAGNETAGAAGEVAGAGRDTEGTAPDIRFIPFPGFSVSYSRYCLFFRLLMQMPAFLYHVAREKRLLGEMVEKVRPDLIVSDNRYGLTHIRLPSVIITHQLRPSLPSYLRIFEGVLSALIRVRLKAFDQCWIPDCSDQRASGRLAEGWEKLPSAHFTGWLSRFDGAENGGSGTKPFRYRLMFILSGPEPQRSILEKIITDRMRGAGVSALMVRGLPDVPFQRESHGSMEIVSFLDSEDMLRAIGESELIVCRPGYSSVMDLLVLGKRAVLVPIPGQTEQEHLAEWLGRRGWFYTAGQKEVDPCSFLDRKGLKGAECHGRGELLRGRVKAVIGIAERRRG